MFDENETVYIRVPFDITSDLSQYDSIRLRMMYDDGFVAYINGTEVARANAPPNLDYNSGATVAVRTRSTLSISISPDSVTRLFKTPMYWQSKD